MERVYPLFRGRYWTSRNTSINLRLGQAALPFLTSELVAITSALPMRYKNYGRLEAAVIAKLDPALASHQSDYGFDFVTGPTLKYKFMSMPSIRRPFWLRRVSYTIQHRRMSEAQAPDKFPDELSRLTKMSRYFRIEHMRDESQINRLFTVEYLVNRLGIADGW